MSLGPQEHWAPSLEKVAAALEENEGSSTFRVREVSNPLSSDEVEANAKVAVVDLLMEWITKETHDLAWYYSACKQQDNGCITFEDWIAGAEAASRQTGGRAGDGWGASGWAGAGGLSGTPPNLLGSLMINRM